MKQKRLKKVNKRMAKLLSATMVVGSLMPGTVVWAKNPKKSIDIDFEQTTGPMTIKTGFQLTPNEDVTDGRIVPLNSSMIRGDLDIQNIMIGNGGNNDPTFMADTLPAQFSRMDRIKEGLTRMNDLGVDYFPVMGYFASWVSSTGEPCAPPKSMEAWEQYVKDIVQYVKDNNMAIDEFNTWNENWGISQEDYLKMHEVAWHAVRDILPDAKVGGPSPTGGSIWQIASLVERCAQKEISADILSWHFRNSDQVINFIDSLLEQYPIVGPVKYYYEEFYTGAEFGANNWALISEIDRTKVDEGIRGIWYYPNGLGDLIRTKQFSELENKNYRTPEWWQTAAYGSMSGERVLNPGTEPYIASIDEEKGEAKVILGYPTDTDVALNFDNLPEQWDNIKVDVHKITKADYSKGIDERLNEMPEDEGIQYIGSEGGREGISLSMDAQNVYMLVIKDEESVPSDFYLKTPDDNAIVTQNPTLSWQKSQGADSYTVTVATDKKMENVVYQQDGITGESHQITQELVLDQMYYWSVTAQNENGLRVPFNNMYYSFTVKENVDVPGPFTMASVYNGESSVSLTPKIGWTASLNADSYIIEIAENEDFTNSKKIDCTDYKQFANDSFLGQYVSYYYTHLEEPLKPQTKYYSRIFAKNENGTRLMNGLTHEFMTTTEDGKPADFALTYPANGGEINQRETLRWEKKPGAFFYRLEIAKDSAFKDMVLDRDYISYPAYTVEADLLEPSTTYYWRVTAMNKEYDAYQQRYTGLGAQMTPSSSGVQSFVTSNIPAAPTVKVTNPTINGGVVIWQPVLGADSYTVKYGTESGKYTQTISGVESDRYFIQTEEPTYCTVVAVRDGVESEVRNEVILNTKEKPEIGWYKVYPAEANSKLEGATIEIEGMKNWVQFNEENDRVEYESMLNFEEIELSYRANVDTSIAIYADNNKMGEIELVQTGDEWKEVSFNCSFPKGATLKLIKETSVGMIDIDNFKIMPKAELVNYALNKKVVADSEIIWNGNGAAANLTDGVANRFWESGKVATLEDPCFAEIDLEEVRDIDAVLFKLPIISDWGKRDIDIRVLASVDGENYTEIGAKETYTFGCTPETNTESIVFEQPVKASKIRIEAYTNTANGNKAQIGEVEVLGKSNKVENGNLALNANITADSSLNAYPWTYPVEVLVDADTTRIWEPANMPTEAKPNWVKIDLGKVYSISTLNLKLPDVVEWSKREQELRVLTSTDGKNFTECIEKGTYSFAPETHNIVELKAPEVTEARYVMVEIYSNKINGNLINGGKAQLAEIEIYEGKEEVAKNSMTIKMDSQVEEGSVLSVTVGVEESIAGVYAQDFVLAYDEALFDFIGIQSTNDKVYATYEKVEGGVRVLIAVNEGLKDSVDTVVVNLQAKMNNNEGVKTTIEVKDVLSGVVDKGVSTVTADILGNNKQVEIVGRTEEVDKSILNQLIQVAKELSGNAVVGNEVGQYPQVAKDKFDEAIVGAEKVSQNSSNQEEINQAVINLNNAVEEFKQSVIKEKDIDVNADGKIDIADLALVAYYYRATPTSDNWEQAQKVDFDNNLVVDINDLATIAEKILGK